MSVQSTSFPLHTGKFRSGPLSFIFEDGRIRSIAVNGREIVRRMYVAVRDEYWNTIPGDISNLSLESNGSCSIAFDSHHRLREVDFLWHGTISCTANGVLSFAMDGKALASFRRKRIGFCLLHASTLLGGQPCIVETANGTILQAAFPRFIAPWQPFPPMTSLRFKTAEGQEATIRFEGDLFEMEDQRNWSDATFKTYAPPVEPAVPEIIELGTIVRQRITITASEAPAVPAISPVSEVHMNFRAPRFAEQFINIGFLADQAADRSGFPLQPVQNTIPRLVKGRIFSHVRIDLHPAEAGFDKEAGRAVSIAQQTALPVECAIHFSDAAEQEAVAVTRRLRSGEIPVCRFLIYHVKGPAFLDPILPAVGLVLFKAFPDANLHAGTNGYFVEINRARPKAGLIDGICYSATPQVHTFDNCAVMENMPGLPETITSAMMLFPGKSRAISPLTLRPRKNPLLPLKDGGPDERRNTLFAAAWLFGSIAYCHEGGLDSLTLGAVCGPDGTLADDVAIFPSFILAAWLKPFAGKRVETRFSKDSSQVIGLQLEDNGSLYAITANCSGEPMTLALDGLPGTCRYSILDEKSFERVKGLVDPERGMPEFDLSEGAHDRTITLPPYAIMRIF
jgi:hypothetical protein